MSAPGSDVREPREFREAFRQSRQSTARDPEAIDRFMAAIRDLESNGNYHAVGVPTKGGRALGAYQIMSQYWPGWAAEAGIPGADWRDPKAQDRVARYKMQRYFERYGRWDLVAIAWFAGPGRANTAANQGIESVSDLSDVLGTSVGTYVRRIMDTMGDAPPDDGPPDPNVPGPGRASGSSADDLPGQLPLEGGPDFPPDATLPRSQAHHLLQSSIDRLSSLIAGGERRLPPMASSPGLEEALTPKDADPDLIPSPDDEDEEPFTAEIP